MDSFMAIKTFLGRRSRAFFLLSGIITVVVIGFLDHLTGEKLNLVIFYLVPLFFVSWYAGKRAGLFFAAFSSLTWYTADYLAGTPSPDRLIVVWNVFARFFMYIVIVITLSRLRTLLYERSRMVRDLRDALDNVKELKGLLPICSWCNNIRDDNGYWKKLETYIQEHSSAEFTHGICPECLRKIAPDTYKKHFGDSGEEEPPKR
jgi:hypothetical protein